MRSKAPLALMEQLVMVLVFALAAALCVRLNCTPAQVPVENLLALLKENGAVLTIPQEVASHENVEKSAI